MSKTTKNTPQMIFARGCYKYCNSLVQELLGIDFILFIGGENVKKISK